MRRVIVVAALTAWCGLASSARAQDPGVTVTDFDKKKGGSEKVHKLARIPAHEGDAGKPRTSSSSRIGIAPTPTSAAS